MEKQESFEPNKEHTAVLWSILQILPNLYWYL